MVTLNIFDAGMVMQIIVLIAAFIMSFLSLRVGAMLWFITGFVWVGLAIITTNQTLVILGSFMAVVSEILFLVGAFGRKGKR